MAVSNFNDGSLEGQIATLNGNLNNLALHRRSAVVASEVYNIGINNLLPNTVYVYFGTSANDTYYWAIGTTDGNGQLTCSNANKWKVGSTIVAIS